MFRMAVMCILLIFLSIFHNCECSTVWMKMAESAVKVVSQDIVERYPAKVFDLRSLVLSSGQIQIQSINLHSPEDVQANIHLSDVTAQRLRGSWRVGSMVVDIEGLVKVNGLNFRIDSRIIMKDSQLSLTYNFDGTEARNVADCKFTFTLGEVRMKNRLLQRFVGSFRQQFLKLPPSAICNTHMHGVIVKRSPLLLFGLPEPPVWIQMKPIALHVQNGHLYVAYQKQNVSQESRSIPGGVLNEGTTAIKVFLSQEFISDVTGPVINDVISGKFQATCRARLTPDLLSEYFERVDQAVKDMFYVATVSVDVRAHNALLTEDGAYLTVPFTLHYNVTSPCAEYNLFTLDWFVALSVMEERKPPHRYKNLQIALRISYNDRSFYLRILDVKSDVSLVNSNLGNPKDTKRLVQYMQLDVHVKDALMEDLGFFLNNTGLLYNTVVSGSQSYLTISSDVSSSTSISPWREFGKSIGDEPISINVTNVNTERLDMSVCGVEVNSGSTLAYLYSIVLVIGLFLLLSTEHWPILIL